MKIAFHDHPPGLVQWSLYEIPAAATSPSLRLMIGIVPAGAVCRLAFVRRNTAEILKKWRQEWPQSEFVRDDKAVAVVARRWGKATDAANLLMVGTKFQQSVWRALAKVPAGVTVSYAELARRSGNPAAVRAVGTACGRNPVPFLIPCHRVIASDGGLGGFSGGLDIKKALLKAEGIRVQEPR